MAARTNLVLKDRAAAPVSHIFSPQGDDNNGVHLFSEKKSVPAENARFSASLRQTSNGRYRANLKLAVPVVQTQTINGVSNPVVVRTAYGEVSFTFDNLSTEQERMDLVGMLADSLDAGLGQINDMLVGLEDIY